MVRVGDMLKKKSSIFNVDGYTEARKMFVERSQIAGEGELGVNRKVFVGLMRDLVEKTNQTAEVADRISIPRKADLKAAFVLADEDGNGTVDEEEFLHLFELVLAGKVKGLGSAGIAFYRAPTQHMQWGGHDFHPDTDWQDLFFDLLFAGGAFCGAGLLGESLVNGQAAEGYAWFLACFLCLAMQWVMRVQYCSRFASTSMFHAIFAEQLEFLLIGLATWHIPLSNVYVDTAEASSYSSYSSYSASASRMLAGSYGAGAPGAVALTPVDQLKANAGGCAFGFSAFLGLNALLYVGRWAEILADAGAADGAKALARVMVVAGAATAATLFAAAALAGFGPSDGDLAADLEAGVAGRGRLCLWLWLGAFTVYLGSLAAHTRWLGAMPEAAAQAKSAPMCITYLIVRVGEWTMVMLGETVLSLLGVPLESEAKVYAMFACAMLVASNLQFQGYTIHPIDSDHHVLKAGQFSFKGLLYLVWATIFYATILVTVGAGFKVLVKKAMYGEVFVGANVCLGGGLAAAFVSIMAFAALHHRAEGMGLGLFDCFTSPAAAPGSSSSRSAKGGLSSCSQGAVLDPGAVRGDLAKAATVVGLLVVGGAGASPSWTVFWAYALVVAQSFLVLHENVTGLNDADDADDDGGHDGSGGSHGGNGGGHGDAPRTQGTQAAPGQEAIGAGEVTLTARPWGGAAGRKAVSEKSGGGGEETNEAGEGRPSKARPGLKAPSPGASVASSSGIKRVSSGEGKKKKAPKRATKESSKDIEEL